MSDASPEPNLSILHITNWYPTKSHPLDGIWIKNQIQSLPSNISSDVFHLRVNIGTRLKVLESSDHCFRMEVPLPSWLLVELATFIVLSYLFLFKLKVREYDILNFHIAYPLCVFLNLYKFFIKKPILINEHWSAYHLNFGVRNDTKLSRVKRIFKQKITLITVSKALAMDIRKFSGNSKLPYHVVPNVVDTDLFHFDEQVNNFFLMASYWKYPKEPLVALTAFTKLLVQFPDIKLKVAGDGPLLDTMTQYVDEHELKQNVVFLGRLSPVELAAEMRLARCFLHISGYETFSVVCAEAICSGTPVIASRVGGIPEFINQSNGYLLSDNKPETLLGVMKGFVTSDQFDRPAIAAVGASIFNKERVGSLYRDAILAGSGIKK